jgi:hypothetical protein
VVRECKASRKTPNDGKTQKNEAYQSASTGFGANDAEDKGEDGTFRKGKTQDEEEFGCYEGLLTSESMKCSFCK